MVQLNKAKRGLAFVLSVSLVGVLAAGCSSGKGNESAAEDKKGESSSQPANPIYDGKPITIKISTSLGTDVYGDAFKRQIEDPIKKKFPNVTIVKQDKDVAKLIAANDPPDIVHVVTSVSKPVFDMKLENDITDLIKKYHYDMGRFLPSITDSLRSLGDKGQIYAIPEQPVLYGLLYNKDVFDKFAVPYPKGKMSWDEAIELGKRLTRVEAGTQYRGLELQGPLQLYSQLALNPITKENKALITTQGWQTAAEIYRRIYTIPGNARQAGTTDAQNTYDAFFNGNLAMLSTSVLQMLSRAKEMPNLQWDVVPFPTFKDQPNNDPLVNYLMYFISSTSKHREEAFEIVTYLASDEVQKNLVSNYGFLTPLKDPAIQKLVGSNEPALKGKNLSALYENKQTNVLVFKETDAILNQAFKQVSTGQSDVNTALRGAEEKLNKQIEAEKAR